MAGTPPTITLHGATPGTLLHGVGMILGTVLHGDRRSPSHGVGDRLGHGVRRGPGDHHGVGDRRGVGLHPTITTVPPQVAWSPTARVMPVQTAATFPETVA